MMIGEEKKKKQEKEGNRTFRHTVPDQHADKVEGYRIFNLKL